ncbi:MAG TPA: hypothetical protein VK864_15820 [Longimicrobiales bacterium]|nr:hypothetical protein [Longimicrobiales bacterium]
MKRWRVNLGWVLLAWLPAPLSAQVAVGSDVVMRSMHVWRGVTRSSRPVLQPSLFAAWQPYGWTVTAGIWSSSELGGLEAGHLTDAGADRHHAEINYWLEGHTRIDGIDLRLGTVRFDLRGDSLRSGRSNTFDTGEVYGAVMVPITDLTLVGAALAYDYDAVRGAYLALQGQHHAPFLSLPSLMASLVLTADAGFTLGQETDPERLTEVGYFADRGLTHVTVSTALRVTFERVGAFLGGSFQFNEDAAARRIRFAERNWRKSWLEAGVSLLVGPSARERR